MTDKRLLSAVLVMTMLMAGAGAAFYGSVIEGGISAIGSIDLGGLLLKDEDNDTEPNQTQTWTSGDCTVTISEVDWLIVSGNGQMADYTSSSPAPWADYSFTLRGIQIDNGVTKIGNYAFADMGTIYGGLVMDGVTTLKRIGEYAFAGSMIASITIPYCTTANNPSVGDRAFYGCENVRSITFASANWTSLGTIGLDAFAIGTSDKPITCPVYSPGNMANGKLNSYGGSYTTFVYQPSVMSWDSDRCTVSFDTASGRLDVSGNGQMADYTTAEESQDPNARAPWYYVRTYMTSVVIGDGVTHIGDQAFYNCDLVTSATFGRFVASIGNQAFSGDTSLASVTIPNAVTSIGDRAFYNCSSIPSLTLGSGVTSIGQNAFQRCTALTSIEFTSPTWTVTSIGSSAFALGTSTRSVTCTVGSPGNMADQKLDAYTTSYTTFNYESTTVMVTVTLAAGTGGSVSPASITVPYGSSVSASGHILTVGSYSATATPSYGYTFSQWSGIPASGTITEDCTITAQFVHGLSWQSGACTVTLDTDTFAMNVTGNGAMADYSDDLSNASQPWTPYMTQIRSLTVGNGVTTIGDCAFIGATSLASVTLPDTAYEIGYGAFRECTSLASVAIPDGVQTIEQQAFRGCTSLTALTIPARVGAIYNFAFADCTGLTSVTVMGGDNSLTLGEQTFMDCTALTSLDLGGRTDVIDNSAFNGCAALTSLELPATVGRIGESAFAGCTSLTTIYYDGLEWGITGIGSNAFSLGTSSSPVTCTVNSPFNIADGKLEAYKGSYTTFTYASHGWYVLTFEADQPGWGTISTQEYQIRENEQITADGDAIMHGGTVIARASPSNPTSQYAYAFYSWSIEGTVTVTSDMTITALFVRASVVPVTVLPQEYVDLDASPSYTGAEQVTDLPSWLSLDGTHLVGQVPAQNDLGSALIYWAKESVEREDWTAYYYVFTATAGKEIELSAGATQDIGSDGTMAILGHGDLTEAMCDMLAPFRDIVTVVDIRGLTSIRAMPEISNQFTLVLGDTVTNYRDQSDSNHFDAVAIGAGIQSFNVPGFTAFDKDGKQITGRELQGRVLKEERARQYIEVGVIDVENHYDNATVYAVKGSTMDNSADDRIVFSVQEDAPSLPNYLRTMLQGAQSSWNVSITSAFKNLQVGQDGVLHGVQADKTGTYTGAQTASMTSSEWGQMYSCTVMQSLAFTAYIADKLEVTS